MMRAWLVLLLLVAVAPRPAWALKPAKHRALLERACSDAGLPDAFCRRAGKQVYETDFFEWTELSAHAQRERGQDRCSAADAAIARVDTLARSITANIAAREYEAAAIDLGRAVHTLQDECAHHGMTNEEHSYYSLVQTCSGDDVSPDVQPAALACAETRTRDVIVRVASALAGTPWDGVGLLCTDFDQRDVCANATLPTPRMACEFLKLHTAWDGDDSTWNGDVVGPALVAAFANGLAGEAAPPPLCADAAAIDPAAPHAHVDDREAGCGLADAICLGKVDEDGEPIAGEPEPTAGCSVGGEAGGSALAMLLLGLVLRRRRS